MFEEIRKFTVTMFNPDAFSAKYFISLSATSDYPTSFPIYLSLVSQPFHQLNCLKFFLFFLSFSFQYFLFGFNYSQRELQLHIIFHFIFL